MSDFGFVKFFGIVLALAAVVIFPSRYSQAADGDGKPIFYTGFSGSYNDPGWMFKLDAAAGYRFNSHFEITAGLPVYFVQVPDDGTDGAASSKSGIGNFYVDLRLMAERDAFYFSSSLRGTAPTGNEEEGFSTGRVTFDWSNYFEYNIGEWTPFANAGIANSVSDTHFFTRPFTSLGIVSQFEGGLLLDPAAWIGLGGSGYYVLPSGEQKIYSRLVSYMQARMDSSTSQDSDTVYRRRRAFEDNARYIAGEEDVTRDYGVSGWLDLYPSQDTVLEIGYSRSVYYDYDTLFFSVRFNIGNMIWNDGF